LHIATTPLATFDACPRRYHLIHEVGVDPLPFGAAAHGAAPERRDLHRALGVAAHPVLETWPLDRWGQATDPRAIADRLALELAAAHVRSAASLPTERPANDGPGPVSALASSIASFLGGAYARHLRETGAALYREERFVVTIDEPSGPLHLRGAIDLVALFPDGSADVIDYKSAWREGDESPSFQLRVYALAANRVHRAAPVRVGVLDLSSNEPAVSLKLVERDALLDGELAALKSRFLAARAADHFPGVERSRCEALRCGFVGACHGRPRDEADHDAPSAHQGMP